jgi:hypothetical protein
VRLIACLWLICLGAACGGLRDLARLQTQLARHFHVLPPGLELRDDTLLIIALQDTGYAAMAPAVRQQRSRDLIRFVLDSSPPIKDLRRITVFYPGLQDTGLPQRGPSPAPGHR